MCSSAQGPPRWIFPLSVYSPQQPGQSCPKSFIGFGHSQCQAKEDGYLLSAVGFHFLQLQSQVLLIMHLLPLLPFRKWKNINTQSMCPSSHLLIRYQCRLTSLNWAGQRFEAHLYTSQARGSPCPTLLLKSFSHKGRRKAAFVLIALARTCTLPLWLSVFPSLTFIKPQGNGRKAFVWGCSGLSSLIRVTG